MAVKLLYAAQQMVGMQIERTNLLRKGQFYKRHLAKLKKKLWMQNTYLKYLSLVEIKHSAKTKDDKQNIKRETFFSKYLSNWVLSM